MFLSAGLPCILKEANKPDIKIAVGGEGKTVSSGSQVVASQLCSGLLMALSVQVQQG